MLIFRLTDINIIFFSAFQIWTANCCIFSWHLFCVSKRTLLFLKLMMFCMHFKHLLSRVVCLFIGKSLVGERFRKKFGIRGCLTFWMWHNLCMMNRRVIDGSQTTWYRVVRMLVSYLARLRGLLKRLLLCNNVFFWLVHLHLPFKCGVEMVFNMVISSTRKKFGYFRPTISKFFVGINDSLIFKWSPFVLLNVWIEMIVPTFPALLPNSTW